MIKNIFLSSLVLLALASASDAFVSTSRGSSSHAGKIIIIRSSQSSKEWNPNCSIQQEVNQQHHPALLNIRGGGIISDSCTRLSFAINPSIASLMAGSIAGAIGVGVAFPLDTLKTKSQVLGQQSDVATSASASASGGGGASAAMSGEEVSQMNMLQLISVIYQMEGIQGFYGGVKGMMVGQAIIKSVAFSANASALSFLQESFALPAAASLLIAACFSGFITSFLVTPIERVKVLLQSQSSNVYKNEFDCIQKVIAKEGVIGIFTRGLGPTLAREVPSYGIYFLIYGLLIQLPLAGQLGTLAPLVFGALTGMASWIPVYPIDVVKTLVQANDGSSEGSSALEVTKQLYSDRGVRGFFDGLTPKMLRAAINHSVTFYIYDLILNALIAS